MDPYTFFALVVAFIIVCVIPIGIGVLWIMGHNPISLYDSFEKRSLFIKIPIAVVIVIVFSYAGILIISAVAVQYQDHVNNSNVGHYDDLTVMTGQFLDNENYDKALSTIDQAIALMPKNSRAYEAKAYILFKEGKLDSALTNITKGIDLDNNLSYIPTDSLYPHPYLVQAAILDTLGRYGEAADSIQNYINYDPTNYDTFETLAEERNMAAEYSQALDSINTYFANSKENPEAYVDRGISNYWLKQCHKAMTDFQYAYGILPEYEYLADNLSSTTLGLFNAVMHDADKYTNPDSCVDAVK